MRKSLLFLPGSSIFRSVKETFQTYPNSPYETPQPLSSALDLSFSAGLFSGSFSVFPQNVSAENGYIIKWINVFVNMSLVSLNVFDQKHIYLL